MQSEQAMETAVEDEMDFASMLEASLAENNPQRGDIVTGTIMSVDNRGLIVDIGWKRDGIVLRKDFERMNDDPLNYEANTDIDVMILRLEDDEGNLVLSVAQAKQNEDWKNAEELMNSGDVWTGEVIDANRGGLIVPFGNIRGFIPASHVAELPRGLNEDERRDFLTGLIGKEVGVKIIEVNRRRRRLVLSQRDAQRLNREARKTALLDNLNEGDTITGVVSGLRDFGAFVDLGGADGLIHISELAWHRVEHPREVVRIGEELEVYVLRLDVEGKRIGLSLKRLQDNPWLQVEDLYYVGQLVEGVVTRVADFGAFISLEPGIEALLHASQLPNPNELHITAMLQQGERILSRVISIEADKQRLGLSLKEVTDEELARWEDEHPIEDDDEEYDDSVEAELEAEAEATGVAEAELEAEAVTDAAPETELEAEEATDAAPEAEVEEAGVAEASPVQLDDVVQDATE